MQFKTVKNNGGILKPESLTQALVGYYRERRPGTYSPIHVIEDLQNKIHLVRGCKDLDDTLINVPFDSLIEVVYVKSVPTRFGHDKVIMKVGIAEDVNDLSSDPMDEGSQIYDPEVSYGLAPINNVHYIPDDAIEIKEDTNAAPKIENRLARFGIK